MLISVSTVRRRLRASLLARRSTEASVSQRRHTQHTDADQLRVETATSSRRVVVVQVVTTVQLADARRARTRGRPSAAAGELLVVTTVCVGHEQIPGAAVRQPVV